MSQREPPRESLEEMLEITARGADCYGATLESFWGQATSGDLLARATLAAGRRRGEPPTALQAVFIGELPPGVELAIEVEGLGRGLDRVRVLHGGSAVAELNARFGPPGGGLAYQTATSDSGLPTPEELPSEVEVARAEGWEPYAVGPIESRRVTPYEPVEDHEPAEWIGWLHPRAPIPANPCIQAAAIAFLAEYRSHWAVERRLGKEFPNSQITLLDHGLWIHRVTPWDGWWKVTTHSDVAASGRCLSRRTIHARDGQLVASAAWQSHVRPLSGAVA